MFDPYLTCQAFGLVNASDDWLREVARSWSRLFYLDFESDGSVQWDSEAALEVEPDLWRTVPSHINLSTHNVLFRLGDLDEVAVIAFISPLQVVSAGFRDAAPLYLGRSHPSAQIVDLLLQLDQIAEHPGRFVIRAVDGTSPDGLQVSYRADRSSWETGIKQIPKMKEFRALEMASGEQSVRLECNYNIRLSGTTTASHVIVGNLRVLYKDMLQSFTRRNQ
jgi:hypothetical protein